MTQFLPSRHPQQHSKRVPICLMGLWLTLALPLSGFAATSLQSNVAGDEMLILEDHIDSTLTADPIEEFIQEHDDTSIYVGQDDLWERIRNGFNIPDIDSEYTAKHENWYASRPDYVKRMLERSQKYLFHIVEEVEKRGMPTEIALLPMIESAYNPQAYSRSHASGIWQFVPATGKDYGLKQNYWADKRRDVTAATNAALTYLQRLHGMFGSWDLALAAYNAGEGTVSRAIERNRKQGLPTDYQHLRLPEETKNYVPKLQAIKNIVFKPDEFGLSLVDIPNKPYFTRVLAPKQIDAKLAAELAEISPEELSALNPSYNRPVIVSNNEVHQLLLPTWAADRFKENLANYDKPLTSWKTYSAKRGERIDYIARKFNIGVSELREVNDLTGKKKIMTSRPILVPNGFSADANIVQASFDENISVKEDNASTENESRATRTIRYKVKRGDTVSSLADKFNVEKSHLLSTNRISAGQLKAGQIIKVVTRQASTQRASSRYVAGSHKKKYSTTSSRYISHKAKKSSKTSHRRTRVSSKIH
ncbi:transglycosylase SLT domain-containing protein [Methylotenera sp. 1P/1]|uniref:transglycosylase SLT domain-containing protein n=1 Tax=Methylotenera sp. 1P/1 TaxID=1131551 RepID=UPI0003693D12|nr:transglycosylase SLT domain-containing protein [Methylotenera sp. 1P/1]